MAVLVLAPVAAGLRGALRAAREGVRRPSPSRPESGADGRARRARPGGIRLGRGRRAAAARRPCAGHRLRRGLRRPAPGRAGVGCGHLVSLPVRERRVPLPRAVRAPDCAREALGARLPCVLDRSFENGAARRRRSGSGCPFLHGQSSTFSYMSSNKMNKKRTYWNFIVDLRAPKRTDRGARADDAARPLFRSILRPHDAW